MARALAHSPRHHSRHFPRYHLSSQAQHRQGTQTCYASSVVLRIFAPCFDSVHLICWNLTIFTLLQIADPHRTKRGNNAPPTHYDFFSLRLPPFVEKRVGAFSDISGYFFVTSQESPTFAEETKPPPILRVWFFAFSDENTQ